MRSSQELKQTNKQKCMAGLSDKDDFDFFPVSFWVMRFKVIPQ